MKQYRGLLIFTGIFLVICAAAFIPFKLYWYALAALAAGILLFIILFIWLSVTAKKQQEVMDRVFRENDSAVA